MVKLAVVGFAGIKSRGVMTDEDLKELQERVFELKMSELFEEPCSYEDEDEFSDEYR